MIFRVFYADAFRAHITEHVAYLRNQHVSDTVIERWYARLFSKLDEVATWPKSYPVDERATEELGQETRKFVYARYVINYPVDEAHRGVIVAPAKQAVALRTHSRDSRDGRVCFLPRDSRRPQHRRG